MNWRDKVRTNGQEALDNPSAPDISALERYCGGNEMTLQKLRKSLADGHPKSAYAQLQIMKDKWGKAGSVIHGLEDELLERMKGVTRI